MAKCVVDEVAQEIDQHSAWSAAEVPGLQKRFGKLRGEGKAGVMRQTRSYYVSGFNISIEHDSGDYTRSLRMQNESDRQNVRRLGDESRQRGLVV
jgi:hypothetical protein